MENVSPQAKPSRRGQFSALAVVCLLAGVLLTLDNIGIINGVWRLWPVFPFFLGIGGIWFFKKARNDLLPLGIGTYLILVSILFFALNYTKWSYMAKLWPSFIGIFGISILIVACFAKTKKWCVASGLLAIFLATVFFMVFTIDASLWPISLILFGVWLLLIPERSPKCEKRS